MEQLNFEKAEYIKIFSYKKVKIDEKIRDVIYLEDLAPAYLVNGKYRIISGRYKDKYIQPLNECIGKEDFVCLPMTLVEKNLITDFQPEQEDLLTIENCRSKCRDYEYFIVENRNGMPNLQVTTDKRIINEFKYAVNPSVSEKLGELIEASQRSEGNMLEIPAETMNLLLNRTNTLDTQDSNVYKVSFKEYNIEEKYEALRKKIIGLDNELKILLANITKNISLSYSKMDIEKIEELKSTLLILGPPGSGKTFMIKSVANLFHVPCAIEDSTRYTPAAYQGASIEDILFNLYYQTSDKELFEHSVIFLDEFDKLCKAIDPKDREISEQVQDALLTIIQGTKISKKVIKGYGEEVITLNTSKMTFILSGAFEELLTKEEIKDEDLIKYGMIRQLAERIRSMIRTKEPTKEDLKNALTSSEFSYLTLFKEYLGLFNVELEFNEAFIDYIVDKAYEAKSGYRGISNALTDYINDYLFDILSGKETKLSLLK